MSNNIVKLKKQKSITHEAKTDVYYVYILECKDTTLYTGSTHDIKKRIQAHNSGKTGAKYTKTRRPVTLMYFEVYPTKSDALKREWEIKKLSREEKLRLTNSFLK